MRDLEGWASVGLDHRDYMRDDEGRPHVLGVYPATMGLIIANVFFFIVPLILIGGVLPHVLRSDFTIGDLHQIFGVVPEKAIGSGWVWQFVTYAFLHDPRSILHLLFNMVALYYFGTEVEGLYGTRRFLGLYFGAAIVAGMFHCIDYGLGVPAIGASGAVYAVMVVFALHYPHRVIHMFFLFFFIPMQVWVLVTIAILGDMSSYFAMGGRDGVAHLAHLGGVLAGGAFYKWGAHLEALADRVEERIERREKKGEEDLDAELDRVLAKINASGMGSLTRAEKSVLDRASKRYRQKS